MLKKVAANFLVLVVFILMAAPGQARAEEKIALVSLQKALNEVEAGKQAKAKLKRDFDVKKKQIDQLKTDLDTQSKGLEKERLVLSQDALKAKMQELQTKYLDLQNKAATYQQELQTQEAQSAQKIIASLRQIVTDISAKEGYTLVIENSADTVLYSKSAQDITDKVIAAYNKR